MHGDLEKIRRSLDPSISERNPVRLESEVNGDGDEREAKRQVGIAEIDETTAGGVNSDQDGVKVESGVNALPPFALRGEGETRPYTRLDVGSMPVFKIPKIPISS